MWWISSRLKRSPVWNPEATV